MGGLVTFEQILIPSRLPRYGTFLSLRKQVASTSSDSFYGFWQKTSNSVCPFPRKETILGEGENLACRLSWLLRFPLEHGEVRAFREANSVRSCVWVSPLNLP